MKLDFEKFLNNNGLKIGDKVKLSNGDICEICRGEDKIFSLRNEEKDVDYVLSLLEKYDFEKVESKKKFGELICYDIASLKRCDKCPLQCITCGGYTHDTLRERFEEILKEYPQLEPLREYFMKELNKEIE